MSGGKGRGWAIAALVWTGIVGIGWLVLPAGQSESATTDSAGTVVIESSQTTLVQSEGPWVITLLAIPVALAAIAVAASARPHARAVRFTVGGLFMVCCILGAASIGLPYVPAAILLLVSAAATSPRPTAR